MPRKTGAGKPLPEACCWRSQWSHQVRKKAATRRYEQSYPLAYETQRLTLGSALEFSNPMNRAVRFDFQHWPNKVVNGRGPHKSIQSDLRKVKRKKS